MLRSENILDMSPQTSVLGKFCCGRRLVIAPNILSNAGTVHFSVMTVGFGWSGFRRHAMRLSSWSCLSLMDFKTVFILASVALGQMAVSASL